jgi:hypothetical protein
MAPLKSCNKTIPGTSQSHHVILPVVLYRHETLSLILREENRWRVFENRVLRRIYVPKREAGEDGHGSMHARDKKYIQNSGWKTYRKETIWKTLAYGGHNIRINLTEIGWEGVDLIYMTQDRDLW